MERERRRRARIRAGNLPVEIRDFRPSSDEQAAVLSCRLKGCLAIGGNRSGKTTVGAVETVYRHLGRHPSKPVHAAPIHSWCISQMLPGSSDKPHVQAEEIRRWAPPAALRGGSWGTAYSAGARTLTWADGGVTEFKCLSPDTPVLLPDGTWTPIDRIETGDQVATSAGPRRVRTVFRYDDAPRFRVGTWGGNSIEATPTHRHKLADGTWKRTIDLRVGEELAIGNLSPATPDTPRPEWELFWTATMIGDGCLRGKQASFTARPGSPVLDDPPLPPGCKLVNARGMEYRVTLCDRRRDNPLVGILKRDGLWGLKSIDKHIPDWVFRQPDAEVSRFLGYLWNTGGTGYGEKRSAYYSTSLRLAEGVQRLLWRLGYRATLCPYEVKTNYGACRYYHVKTNWQRSPYPRGRVKSIEEIEPGPVVCLEVEDVHEFVAAGLVTGNSYDQTPLQFEAAKLHWIWYDEEPPLKSLFSSCLLRLVDYRGQWLMTLTPILSLMGAGWVEELWEDRAEALERGDYETHQLFTSRNTVLDQDEVTRTMASLTDEERQVRAYGAFARLGGRVLSEYDPARHEFDDFIPPRDWKHRLWIDPGWATAAHLFNAVDPEGDIWNYAEHYKGEWTPKQHLRVCDGLWRAYGEPPIRVYMDPAGFSIKRTTYGKESPSDADEYLAAARELGLTWFRTIIPADNGDPYAWRLKRYLANGRWHVARSLTWWRWEQERWTRQKDRKTLASLEHPVPDAPIDRYNHLMDLSRYTCNEIGEPLPSREERPEPLAQRVAGGGARPKPSRNDPYTSP